ncbi:MAG: hypothetical protein RLZ33_1915 [Bacteroidota bacterium]
MLVKKCNYFISILLTCVWGFSSIAQLDGNFIDKSQDVYIPFTITHYGTKHGLPQNQILDIIPKKNGELILATANGIVQFNGFEFFEFIPNNFYKKSLHEQLIYDDKSNKLYGKEYGGKINKISPNFELYLSVCYVQLINDTLYSLDFQGTIYKCKLGETKQTKIINTSVPNASTFIKDGSNYYVGNDTQLFKVTSSGKKTLLFEDHVRKIKQNPYSKELFFLCKNAVYKLNKQHVIEKVTFDEDISSFVLTDIDFIDEIEYFVSSSKGLIYFSTYYQELYDLESYLPTQYLQSLYYNKNENCLFVGTGEKGLLKLHLKTCASLKRIDGKSTALNSIIKTQSGKTLIGGSDNTIFELGFDGLIPYYSGPYNVACLSEIDNRLYVGTWGSGVIIFEENKVVDSICAPQLLNQYVHSVYKDSRGTIWIGNDKGVSRGKTKKTLKPFERNKIDNRIICFYELRDGTICIGGKDGVYFVTPQGVLKKSLTDENGLHCKEVRSFYEDKSGKLWIGTYDGGLYCWDKNRLTSINSKKNCALKMDVFTIAPNSEGLIFMTSNTGLWVVEEKKLNDFYTNKLPYLIPMYYGEESGILNTEFNGGFQNNFYKSPTDHYYFPSIEGIVIATPEKNPFRKLYPVFKSLVVNDTAVKLGHHHFLRSTRSIGFEFYSPSYLNKFNVYYQYKLEGWDLPNEWSNLQKEGTINFTMLPPGHYVLKVRCLDGFNDSNPIELSYPFHIAPYFYETSWFIIFTSILIILLIYFFIKLRTKRHSKRQLEENKINNTILELKLKAIQSKMNPHFIFNSLNNVIYLLNSERYPEAENLLQNFSLLLRRFLENSDLTFISIKNELEILNLYLAIEKIRYSDKFTFEINYPKELAEKLIPTMLIQPFVENAVKHGIAHKTSHSNISISIYLIHQLIVIEIKDNGIGRKESNRINQNRKNHESKGIQLVKSKIEIVKLKYNLKIDLEIEDVETETEKGTKVILKIPMYD